MNIWPEFARFVGVGRTKAFQLVRDGAVEYVRVSADRKVPRRAAIAFLERKLVRPINGR
jgi:hypothetical protein